MSNKIQITKAIVGAIVRFGTGSIVYAIVRNNTTPESAFEKISIPAGSFVLGGIASDAARQYSERMIDDLVETFGGLKDNVKSA